jgi:hypothetical protein
MEELERSAVQLWEAKRLASYDDVSHGRLALLLLDNAAETSLMRSAQSSFVFAETYNNLTYLLRDVDPGDAESQRLKQEVEERTLSSRRRRQIERNFNDLVDYVFARDDFELPAELSQCLKILHRYRNAAYHHDTVRPDVLRPAVQIHFYLCCQLLKYERSVFHEIGIMPASVREIFGDKAPEPSWPGNAVDSASLGADLADFFLADRGLDHSGVALALSDHLVGRLAVLDRHLTTIGDSIPPGINRWATLRLVQLAPREREDFDKETPDDFWTRPLPVTEEVMARWNRAAAELRKIDVAYDALRAFAEIEEPLELLEEPVGRFIEDIDRAEQQRIDELRGK